MFGHALVQIQKTQPRRAVLVKASFRAPDLAGLIERVHGAVGHYGLMRVELVRIGGELVGTGSPYFLYESPEQMAELVRLMQEAGAVVSNSHTSNVRLVGKKEITARDLAFKREVDPHGLNEPRPLRGGRCGGRQVRLALPTDAWTERLG